MFPGVLDPRDCTGFGVRHKRPLLSRAFGWVAEHHVFFWTHRSRRITREDTSFAAARVSTGAQQVGKSIPGIRRRVVLEAKCERVFGVNASELINTMKSSVRCSSPNYFTSE